MKVNLDMERLIKHGAYASSNLRTILSEFESKTFQQQAANVINGLEEEYQEEKRKSGFDLSEAGKGGQAHGREANTYNEEKFQRKSEAKSDRENMLRTEMIRKKEKVSFPFYFIEQTYMLQVHNCIKDEEETDILGRKYRGSQ